MHDHRGLHLADFLGLEEGPTSETHGTSNGTIERMRNYADESTVQWRPSSSVELAKNVHCMGIG
jgi:hypothetical protein